jgi:hypothetical protein
MTAVALLIGGLCCLSSFPPIAVIALVGAGIAFLLAGGLSIESAIDEAAKLKKTTGEDTSNARIAWNATKTFTWPLCLALKKALESFTKKFTGSAVTGDLRPTTGQIRRVVQEELELQKSQTPHSRPMPTTELIRELKIRELKKRQDSHPPLATPPPLSPILPQPLGTPYLSPPPSPFIHLPIPPPPPPNTQPPPF